MTVCKKDLVEELIRKRVDKEDAVNIVNAWVEGIAESLLRKEDVKLTHFCSLLVVENTRKQFKSGLPQCAGMALSQPYTHRIVVKWSRPDEEAN